MTQFLGCVLVSHMSQIRNMDLLSSTYIQARDHSGSSTQHHNVYPQWQPPNGGFPYLHRHPRTGVKQKKVHHNLYSFPLYCLGEGSWSENFWPHLALGGSLVWMAKRQTVLWRPG